jgi:proliferating cell nuclear antigen PCNA
MKRSSVGMQMIEGLSEKFGLDDAVENANKRVKSSYLKQANGFDAEYDSFCMSTHMVKVVSQVADCIKDNVAANFKFDSEGISIFAFYHSQTVCINVQMGKDFFDEKFSCDKQIFICLNLSTYAKKISMLQKCKVDKISFTNKDEDLMLFGQKEQDPTAEIALKSLNSDIEEIDLSDIDYKITIRLQSSEFSRLIDCMPANFTICFDSINGHLVFQSDEDLSRTKLPLRLEPEVVREIQKHESLKNYKQSFIKANMTYITKGAKLSEHVRVGFSQKQPLFVQYVISESSDLNPSNDSIVNMYFSPKVSDEIESEDI